MGIPQFNNPTRVSIEGYYLDQILESEGIASLYFGLDDLVDKLGLQGKVFVCDSQEFAWGFDLFFEDPRDAFMFQLRYSHFLEDQ